MQNIASEEYNCNQNITCTCRQLIHERSVDHQPELDRKNYARKFKILDKLVLAKECFISDNAEIRIIFEFSDNSYKCLLFICLDKKYEDQLKINTYEISEFNKVFSSWKEIKCIGCKQTILTKEQIEQLDLLAPAAGLMFLKKLNFKF